MKPKPRINVQRVFQGFRKLFGVRTYAHVADLAGFDSGNVSRMRSGKAPISCAFFLAICIALNLSPINVCHKVGIPVEYFKHTDS